MSSDQAAGGQKPGDVENPKATLVKNQTPKENYGSSSNQAKAAPKNRGPPFVATTSPPLWVALNPLIWILWLLDFLVWFLNPLSWFRLLSQCCVGGASYETEPGVRRATDNLMTTPFKGAETMHDVAQIAFKNYATLRALGTRQFEGWVQPEGQRFPLKVFGDTTWITYAEFGSRVAAFGSGLRSLGVEPMPAAMAQSVTGEFTQIDGPHCILVYEETCADWTTATLGAMSQSISVATSYATLGMDAVGEALRETSSPIIVCNYKDVKKVITLADSCPTLTTIIYTRNCVEEDKPALEGTAGRLRVFSFDEVLQMGRDANIAFSPPTADHVGLIMYTSGSTGKPKGVMLKHRNITGAVAGLEKYFLGISNRATSEYDQEVYLAYLPAAHILEFAAEMSMLTHGAMIGYADPKTLSSTGARRKMPDGSLNGEPTGFGNLPPGAIQEFAPTVMAAVPKIWDILKKGIESKVGTMPSIVQAIFLAGFAARSAALQGGRNTPIFNLLFNKFYKVLGGRIKVAVSGGGPISADIQNFIRVAFKFPLVQGYGLTETCSTGTIQPYWSNTDGIVGPPLHAVEIKVHDCTEVLDRNNKPYLATDKDHLGDACVGRGEVWIRGAAVAAGYYLMEEKTKSDFTDGWFHTGDIAIWTPNGMLKIVDRLKNLVKLKGGEYIAIESMEATYAQSPFVNGINGGIMCYGDGNMDRPVALVQCNTAELKQWATAQGIAFDGSVDLCSKPEAEAHVLKNLNSIGKGKLGGNELLAAVALLPGTGEPTDGGLDCPWTPENQYLTASNKLNRKPILEGFKSLMGPLIQKGIR